MANKIKGINIKIGADTTGLDTALKNIENSGKGTRSELSEINRALSKNRDSVVLWSQKQEVLTKAIENSREKTKALEQAQKGIEQAFRDGDIDRQAYDKFHQKLDKAKDKLKDLKNQQTDFEQKFQSGEIDKDAYDKFIEKVRKAEQEVQGLENSQRSMQENVRLKTVSEEQYRAFQREVQESERYTRNLETQLTETNQELQRLGNQAEDTAEDVGNSANGGYTVLGNVFANVITKGIELAGTALKNFTRDVVATGMEYESAISNVVAISGAMSEEVELLQAKAEEMGATTKFTAAESAEAMGYMAMAGWKVNDMVSGLDGIMDLSAASGESLASVSDIVTDALTAFGLQASDSAHFADVLAAASSNANTNVSMMGETFKYAAPIAGALGFSIEDTAEAIGLMANSGIKASQAGTSLRSILTQMSGSIMLTGDKLGQFTVNTSNADGSMRNLSDILAELREGWDKLTESEQAANAEEVAGKNAMSGFLALMNSAPADIDKLSTAIKNADGTAQNMASTMLDNLQGDKTLLDSAVDGMKIAISKELNPALRDIVQYATSQIPKVQAVVEPLFKGAVNGVKSLISGFEKMKPVLSAVKPLIITIFANEAIHLFSKTLLPKALELLGKIPTPLTLISNLITSIAGIPAKFIATIGKIPSLIGNIGTAFKGLWTVIAANPAASLVTLGVALTGVAFAAKKHIDNIEIEKTELEKLIEKHNEELRLLADKRQAIRDLDNAFYENVDGIENQTDRTKDLWKELDKLADQYGNVQQKDQARAKYLLGELNEALGTEYTMTGHQIDNYRTLSAEIDNVIAKKQAEMMLDAYLANSTEMTKQRIEARSKYEEYNRDYKEKHKILEDARKEYEEVSGESWENLTKEVDQTKAFNIIDADSSLYSDPEKYAEAAKKLWSADNEERQARSLRKKAEQNYQATSEYFEKRDRLYEAYSLGQYDKMAEIIYAEKDLTSTTLDESATDAEQRLEVYSSNLQKMLSDFDLAVRDMKQKSVDELEKGFTDLMQSGAVAGADALETWEKFKPQVLEFQKNGLDISPIINGLVDSGITPSQAFDNWQEVFRTQLKNGGDMNAMLQWMNNSNYKHNISSVFGSNEDFIKYIKEQSRKGIDISTMLELGAKSGLTKSEEFVKIFKSKVAENLKNGWDVGNLLEVGNQTGVDFAEEFAEGYGRQMQTLKDNGVDLTEFIKHAEADNKTAAEVLGENFKAELTEYLKDSRQTAIETVRENYLPQIVMRRTLPERLIKAFADGKDISELVKKAEKQGLQVGDVFGDNYTDVIQQQIDKGYSITELLEWGETSGLKTGDMLGKNYTNEVQSFVNDGFSIVLLLEWAESAGLKAGDVFGANFRETADRYIERQEKVENIRQEIADISGFWGNIYSGNKKTKFMADGGFLRTGQAVVAEAGPELLEIVNGGVRVTPLSKNSRNSAVNQGQKIFYSNYTINATIKNGYDISRLAEDLETERRRLERGMGK